MSYNDLWLWWFLWKRSSLLDFRKDLNVKEIFLGFGQGSHLLTDKRKIKQNRGKEKSHPGFELTWRESLISDGHGKDTWSASRKQNT